MTHSAHNSITILIATKNRKEQLVVLLNSIYNSSVLPDKIVIVYAGQDITEILDLFHQKLKIELIYSSISSQSYQKKLGIRSLHKTEGWVLFLDDDLIVENTALEKLQKNYLFNKNIDKYGGIGMSIKNLNKSRPSFLTRYILLMMNLYSNKPGSILKSGHPQSYLTEQKNCEVSWLNGASVWRADVIDCYGVQNLKTKYSAYEDVFFSYQISKRYKLLYASDVFISLQEVSGKGGTAGDQFKYASYLRFFFVDLNKEFSKFLLLYSQVFRSFEFVIYGTKDLSVMRRIDLVLRIYLNLVKAAICKTKGIDLVDENLI